MTKSLVARSFLFIATLAVVTATGTQQVEAQNWGRVIQRITTPQQRRWTQPQPQPVQPRPVNGQGWTTYPVAPPANNWNPVVIDSGKQVTGVTYDPFTGRVIVQSDQSKVRESYYDPNRSNIDPGSYHYVNRYESDGQGGQWHVTGYSWTSNGQPHGNLTRRRVSNTGVPGVDHDERENVAYSVQQQNGSTPQAGSSTRTYTPAPRQQYRQTTPQRQSPPANPGTRARYSPF